MGEYKMNLTTFSLSICGAFLIASLSTNYILYNKLDDTKIKLTLSEVSNKNLTKSLEIQNKAIEDLRVDTTKTNEKFLEISRKYEKIVNEEKNLEIKIKELQNKGLSTSEAVCKVNLDLIEGVVNEFFEK